MMERVNTFYEYKSIFSFSKIALRTIVGKLKMLNETCENNRHIFCVEINNYIHTIIMDVIRVHLHLFIIYVRNILLKCS